MKSKFWCWHSNYYYLLLCIDWTDTFHNNHPVYTFLQFFKLHTLPICIVFRISLFVFFQSILNQLSHWKIEIKYKYMQWIITITITLHKLINAGFRLKIIHYFHLIDSILNCFTVKVGKKKSWAISCKNLLLLVLYLELVNVIDRKKTVMIKNEEKDTSPGLRNNSNNLIMNDKDQNWLTLCPVFVSYFFCFESILYSSLQVSLYFCYYFFPCKKIQFKT